MLLTPTTTATCLNIFAPSLLDNNPSLQQWGKATYAAFGLFILAKVPTAVVYKTSLNRSEYAGFCILAGEAVVLWVAGLCFWPWAD